MGGRRRGEGEGGREGGEKTEKGRRESGDNSLTRMVPLPTSGQSQPQPSPADRTRRPHPSCSTYKVSPT